MRDKKNILIGALLIAILAMSVGYAAFAQQLTLNGTASIDGNWSVEIIGIDPTVTGTAKDDSTVTTFTPTSATFGAKLSKPGDSITYTVKVKNNGNIDAKLDSISLTAQDQVKNGGAGSDAILYEIVSSPAKDSKLAVGAETTVVVKITYDPSVTSVPTVKTRTFTGTINYVQD